MSSRSTHEFIHGQKGPSSERRPSASPESRHLWRRSLKISRIAFQFRAAATCVMIAFVALPTLQSTHPPTHPVTKEGEGECIICPSFGRSGEVLSSGTFCTCSQSEWFHPAPRLPWSCNLCNLTRWNLYKRKKCWVPVGCQTLQTPTRTHTHIDTSFAVVWRHFFRIPAALKFNCW